MCSKTLKLRIAKESLKFKSYVKSELQREPHVCLTAAAGEPKPRFSWSYRSLACSTTGWDHREKIGRNSLKTICR